MTNSKTSGADATPNTTALWTVEDREIASRNNRRSGDRTLGAQYRADDARDSYCMHAMTASNPGDKE